MKKLKVDLANSGYIKSGDRKRKARVMKAVSTDTSTLPTGINPVGAL